MAIAPVAALVSGTRTLRLNGDGLAARTVKVDGQTVNDWRMDGPDLLIELTGNETIVTCVVGAAQVIVKMDKDFDAAVDAQVGIRINPRIHRGRSTESDPCRLRCARAV